MFYMEFNFSILRENHERFHHGEHTSTHNILVKKQNISFQCVSDLPYTYTDTHSLFTLINYVYKSFYERYQQYYLIVGFWEELAYL